MIKFDSLEGKGLISSCGIGLHKMTKVSTLEGKSQ